MMNLYAKTLVITLLFLSALGNIQAQSIKERIECPGQIKVTSEFGNCGAEVGYTEPFAQMTVGELRHVQHNYTSESYFEVGENTVFYKAMDQQNNNYFCLFVVHVEDKEEPRFIDFPDDIELETTASLGAMVKWSLPVAEDNCRNVELISSHESGEMFPVGRTLVTYWAHDEAGNVSSEKFAVTVKKMESLVSIN